MSSKKILRSGVLFTSLLFIPACMTSQREEELQSRLTEMRIELSKVREDIARKSLDLETVKNTSADASRRVQGSSSDLEEIRRQLAMTQGALDEFQVKFKRFTDSAGKESSGENLEFQEFQDATARRLARLELISEFNRTRQKSDKKLVKAQSADALEKAILAAWGDKDFKKVISMSSAVLSDEEAPIAMQEVALRYRGEAHFSMQEYQLAAISLSELAERFPKSQKRNRALLLTGDSFVYMQDNKNAVLFYKECVKTAPDAQECKAASERLAKLNP